MNKIRKMLRTFGRLRREEDGSEAIEFVLIFPGFLLILMGAVEFTMVVFVGSILESAMAEASRFGITGATPPGVTREDQVKAIVKEKTYGLIDMSKADFQTLVYPTFADIGQGEPYTDSNGNGQYDAGEPYNDVNGNGQWDADMGVAGLGGPGDIVLYKISYTWGMLTPVLEPIVGSIKESASIAVRNEPY
ncbi:MAG: TadE/TadG family type IV pilus assembly protein [Candidatus Eiseniibacteriota bacterium]